VDRRLAAKFVSRSRTRRLAPDRSVFFRSDLTIRIWGFMGFLSNSLGLFLKFSVVMERSVFTRWWCLSVWRYWSVVDPRTGDRGAGHGHCLALGHPATGHEDSVTLDVLYSSRVQTIYLPGRGVLFTMQIIDINVSVTHLIFALNYVFFLVRYKISGIPLP